MINKIIHIGRLPAILSRIRKQKKKIVFTNGCFDIIHAGHVRYIAAARALGDILIVGLNSDRAVRAIKGRGRPINPQNDRAIVIASLEAVSYVIIFDELTPERLILSIHPDTLVKGGDWKVRDIIGGAFVKSYGGKIARIPFVKGRSTTDTLSKIASL